MKKQLMLVAVLGMFAVTPAFADKGDMWFGLNGGMSGPTGDFGDVTDMGYHGTLTGTYFITPMFGLGADIGYHWWNAKDEFTPAGADANSNAIQATAQGTFMIPMQGKARPYLAGGLGIYRSKAEVTGATDPAENGEFSSSDFGYNLGGGINWMASPMYQIGIGAGYHSIQGDETTNFYTVGVNLLWGKGSN